MYGDTDGSHAAAAKPDHVYMDAMGFGMGLSCLQMTFQARTEVEARVLYDHLTPLCPVLVGGEGGESVMLTLSRSDDAICGSKNGYVSSLMTLFVSCRKCTF